MRKLSKEKQLQSKIRSLEAALQMQTNTVNEIQHDLRIAETRERQSQDMLIRAEKLAVERKQAEEDGIVIQQLTNIANSAVPDNALLSSAWHHSGGVTTNMIFVGQVRSALKLIQRLQNGAAK
jgi:hypothetical protein